MAVHDLGYREWKGARRGGASRWWVIATTGIQRAWQSRWVRRLTSAAWLPAAFFAVAFFLWEKSLLSPDLAEPLVMLMRSAPEDVREIAHRGLRAGSMTTARHDMWSWLLYSFFRKPQGFLMVVIVGMIAPRLVSQDIRSRAFLLYFSRPLGRLEYVLGKVCTVLFYVALISALPALMLYVLGVLLSPSLAVVGATWDLPLRILAATAVLAIPTAGLSLCLSSLTQESRIAGFAWYATWILGWITYAIMTGVEFAQAQVVQIERYGHPRDPRHLDIDLGRWANFSLYHTLGQVQSWVFGFSDFSEVWVSVLIVLVLTVVTFAILFRRVTAPMRA